MATAACGPGRKTGPRHRAPTDFEMKGPVMFLRASAAGLLAITIALPALADPATPDGARRVEAALRTYLGPAEGLIEVTPEGDSYATTIDPAALFALARDTGITGAVAPIHLVLTDKGDGLWGVAQDEPMALTLNIPGALSLDLRTVTSTWEGTFDTDLLAFTESQGSVGNMRLVERISEPQGPVTTVTYTLDRMDMQTSAVAATGGGVDGTLHYLATGLTETVAVEGGPSAAAPMAFDMAAASYDVSTTTKGVETGAIYELIAWAVAHPSQEAVTADFDGLKAAARAALPLWRNITGSGEMKDITVTTPFGSGGATSAHFEIDMNGIVSDGRFREQIAVKGLVLPTGLMPAWAPPLVPAEATIDVAVSGFDLATPAQILLDEAQPGMPPSADMNVRLLSALLPDGTVTVTLAPGGVVAPSYSVDVEGGFDAGPGRMPEGGITIGASGIEAAIDALNTAPEQVRSGGVPLLMMLRGIAKPSGVGRYVWQIDMGADGKVLVNGLDMSSVAGAMK